LIADDIFWILLAIIASSAPVLLIKEYIQTNMYRFIVISIMAYLTSLFTYIHIFKKYEISKMYSIIKIAQFILVAIIAIILYNEKINKNKLIGFGTGIISIIYLNCS
jgi:multidrug transporter EmrE-like cation transporter